MQQPQLRAYALAVFLLLRGSTTPASLCSAAPSAASAALRGGGFLSRNSGFNTVDDYCKIIYD